jgi:hypothetical protein
LIGNKKKNGYDPKKFEAGLKGMKGLSSKRGRVCRKMMNFMGLKIKPRMMKHPVHPIKIGIMDED